MWLSLFSLTLSEHWSFILCRLCESQFIVVTFYDTICFWFRLALACTSAILNSGFWSLLVFWLFFCLACMYFISLISGFDLSTNKRLQFCLILVCIWFLNPNLTASFYSTVSAYLRSKYAEWVCSGVGHSIFEWAKGFIYQWGSGVCRWVRTHP